MPLHRTGNAFTSSALAILSVLAVACAAADHLVPVGGGDGDGGAGATVASSGDATTPSTGEDASATTQDASASAQDASATTQDGATITAASTTQDASATTIAAVSTAASTVASASTSAGMMCPVGFGDCDGLGCTTLLDADADHCGACGHSCLGGACTLGVCQPLVIADVLFMEDFALDGNDVYFTTVASSGGQVRRVAKTGGPTSLVINAPEPRTITVDATHVYWTDYNDLTAERSLVRALKVNANGTQTLAWAFGIGPIDVVVDGTSAYYTTSSHASSVPLAGGAGTLFATEPAYRITQDAGTVFWTTIGDPNGGSIRSKVIGAAGMPSTLAIGQTDPDGIAAFQGNVYWTTPASSSVKRAPAIGGPATTIANDARFPHEIAVDASGIYWSEIGGSNQVRGIWKADHNGGARTLFHETTNTVKCLALDADAVYWTEGSKLLRFPKI